jgi:hypothetical protein
MESGWAVGDLAEAAMRSGHQEEARMLMLELEAVEVVSHSPMLRVGLSYARPLLADENAAEDLYLSGLTPMSPGGRSSEPASCSATALGSAAAAAWRSLGLRSSPRVRRSTRSVPSRWATGRDRNSGPRARPAIREPQRHETRSRLRNSRSHSWPQTVYRTEKSANTSIWRGASGPRWRPVHSRCAACLRMSSPVVGGTGAGPRCAGRLRVSGGAFCRRSP